MRELELLFSCLVSIYGLPISSTIRIDAEQMLQIEKRFAYIEERLDSEAKIRRESVQTILHTLYEIGDKIDQQIARARHPLRNIREDTRVSAQLHDSNLVDLIHALMKAFQVEKKISREAMEHVGNITETYNRKTSYLEDQIQTNEKRAQRHLSGLDTILSDIKQTNLDILSNIQILDQNLSVFKECSKISSSEILDRLDNCDWCSHSSIKTGTILSVDQCGEKKIIKFESCLELHKNGFTTSGVYDIHPDNEAPPIRVYCDQDTDGGGWIVFQRREDGSVNFYRNWFNYEVGFGNLTGEFWLGNENLHRLTANCCHELRIDMQDFENNRRYAKYSSFSIGSKANNYLLTVEGYVGNAGDGLSYHNNESFSTYDKDNDKAGNCAAAYKGAWWYKKCHLSNLNGRYLGGEHESHALGVNWHPWRGYKYSLQTTEMKFRSSYTNVENS